jgi:hypothetical protein
VRSVTEVATVNLPLLTFRIRLEVSDDTFQILRRADDSDRVLINPPLEFLYSTGHCRLDFINILAFKPSSSINHFYRLTANP